MNRCGRGWLIPIASLEVLGRAWVILLRFHSLEHRVTIDRSHSSGQGWPPFLNISGTEPNSDKTPKRAGRRAGKGKGVLTGVLALASALAIAFLGLVIATPRFL